MEWRRWIDAIRARLTAIVRIRRVEKDLDDELAFHVAMQARANARDGMSEGEAYRRARVEIGGVEQVKERSRDVLPLRWTRDAVQDVVYGLRGLRKSPRFSVAALLTVVLGVGANATIFSVLNPLLFKPLPYLEPDRIVHVFRTSPQSDRWPHAMGNYLDHRDRNTVFEHLAAMMWRDASLADPGQPAERLLGVRASGNFFAVFGVPPLHGRTFDASDDQPGAAPVVVLSHGFWQRRFAGDRRIIGRQVRLDGQDTIVIGVMPENYEYPLFWGAVDIWRPLAFPAQELTIRGSNFLREFGRLKTGVTPEQADAAMKAIGKQILAEHTELDQREGLRVESLSIASPSQRRISAFAFGLAFLVLLIACVNLANLQLARTAARAREFAIRGAIGGGKGRLMRQSLTESLLVSLLGGVLAIPLSYWCTQLIATRQFADLPGVRITLDPVTLAFAFGCALLTGVIFGVAPAWMVSRGDLNDVLKQSTQSTVSSRTPQRLRHALIVAEIAFALVTLAGSVSLIRGLQRLTGIDPGWRADGVVSARVNLAGPRYTSPRARLDFYNALQERVRALPGVTSAALSTSGVPVGPFNTSTSVVAEGRSDVVLVYGEAVMPDYFDALGITLRRGRVFTSADRFGQTRVTIVNETMARRLWPNEDPIGKRIGPDDENNPDWREVVGVVADVTYPSFASTSPVDTNMQAYRPIAQFVPGAVSIILRTAEQPDAIAPGLAHAVAALDRDLPVYGVMTARASEQRNTAGLRLMSNVLGGFALLGLVLAAVGIFGVVSYSTAQRAGELGMRMALGARQSAVVWLVLKHGVSLTMVGAIVGLAGGLGLGRLLSSMMPNLPAPEFSIIVAVCAFMVVVALAAFSIPAWRASRTNPMLVLRHE
jgi:predicted permease